jgi:hypothetical protein
LFGFLGQMVNRGWLFWLAASVLLLAGTWWATDPWDQVAQDREFAFLPEDAPSRVAEAVYAKTFPEDPLGSNVVQVLHRAGKEAIQRKRDLQFIADYLEPGLRDSAEAEGGLALEIISTHQQVQQPVLFKLIRHDYSLTALPFNCSQSRWGLTRRLVAQAASPLAARPIACPRKSLTGVWRPCAGGAKRRSPSPLAWITHHALEREASCRS